jgi:hypothetical protein
MYPSVQSSDLVGSLMAGGLTLFLVLMGVALLGMYFNYRVMKAAVRNGVVEALAKTGGSSPSGTPLVQGYPPEQTYVAPPAPSYRGGAS